MLVLGKPPYLRWLAAAALLAGALLWEVRSASTQPVAVAATTITRGQRIDTSDIEWRDVAVGTFVAINPAGTTAVVEIVAGDPITQSVVTTGGLVPDDWWTVAADVPVGAVRGSAVRVVFGDGFGVTGLVVEPSSEDTFGIASAGLIAVPGDVADLVAMAASVDDLVVLFEP